MPEKEGAEEKTTKSVVNKKQKQMMGEEGYDHLRDMGRVRPSKDKKDATTMPPSKEMKKTQKVNKGPSALERVKADIEKKYGKGAIMKVGKKKVKEELDLTKVAEAFGGYIIEAQDDSEAYRKELEKMYSRSRNLQNVDPPSDPKTGEKILRKIKKHMVNKKFKQQELELGNTKTTNTPRSTTRTLRGRPLGSKNKSKETYQQQEIPFDQTSKETPKIERPETITRTKTKSGKVTGDVEPIKPFGPKASPRSRNRVLQKVRVAARTAKMPVQRIVKPTGKLLTKTAKVAAKNPFATLVGASMAKDQFFPVALPKPPTVQGGKVGRRTAG